MEQTSIPLDITFRTETQKELFACKVRNQCISGGLGSGKTYIACEKIVYLLITFPGYRVAIARYEESKLKKTTLQTFFKICHPGMYDPKLGGNRADSQNELTLINGSKVIWMNLKETDDGMIRGLEVNSIFVDQAEEITEGIFIFLKARVGRWDKATVPQHLLDINPNWPKDRHGRYKVPNYMILACNPDSEIHWIYRRFHEDSELHQKKYSKKYKMFTAITTAATMDEENLAEHMDNDQEWVDRFVFGKWGIPGGQIHRLTDENILSLSPSYVEKHSGSVLINQAFIDKIIEKGVIMRAGDHGDSSPTSCLWFSHWQGDHYCFLEYCQPDKLISYHRQQIHDLSANMYVSKSVMDPAIEKKSMQKNNKRWSVFDEYKDKNIIAVEGKNRKMVAVPPIVWEMADNNEMVTRNRISELLRPSSGHRHPVTGKINSPKMYFIIRTPEYPNGCINVIQETRAQRRTKIGTIDGRDIFSEERDPKIVDHAYDCLRYYTAEHGRSGEEKSRELPTYSFGNMRNELKALKLYGVSNLFGKKRNEYSV